MNSDRRLSQPPDCLIVFHQASCSNCGLCKKYYNKDVFFYGKRLSVLCEACGELLGVQDPTGILRNVTTEKKVKCKRCSRFTSCRYAMPDAKQNRVSRWFQGRRYKVRCQCNSYMKIYNIP